MSIARFPRLLVSVRNSREAIDALAGGADWIDLKEPANGTLGAVAGDLARYRASYPGSLPPLSGSW